MSQDRVFYDDSTLIDDNLSFRYNTLAQQNL